MTGPLRETANQDERRAQQGLRVGWRRPFDAGEGCFCLSLPAGPARRLLAASRLAPHPGLAVRQPRACLALLCSPTSGLSCSPLFANLLLALLSTLFVNLLLVLLSSMFANLLLVLLSWLLLLLFQALSLLGFRFSFLPFRFSFLPFRSHFFPCSFIFAFSKLVLFFTYSGLYQSKLQVI